MENNMFEDIVAEGNIVVIDNYWIVLCKRWRPECHNLFCYLYLHKEAKNLMPRIKRNLLGWLPTRNVLCFLKKCSSMELLSISTSII